MNPDQSCDFNDTLRLRIDKLPRMSDATHPIREAMARVAQLRQAAMADTALSQALNCVKQLQAQRFKATYPDLLSQPVFAPSATFFLDELYSAQDFSQRDAQFVRIADAIERTFPAAVLRTVQTLTQLHSQTEALDFAMAQAWQATPAGSHAARYVAAWRAVGQRSARHWQLQTVLEVGNTLGQLTRKPGLRLLLKLMRRPAELAGLGKLQGFLESGFDHFATMAKARAVAQFLATIHSRETGWIALLSDADALACEAELTRTLPSAATA